MSSTQASGSGSQPSIALTFISKARRINFASPLSKKHDESLCEFKGPRPTDAAAMVAGRWQTFLTSTGSTNRGAFTATVAWQGEPHILPGHHDRTQPSGKFDIEVSAAELEAVRSELAVRGLDWSLDVLDRNSEALVLISGVVTSRFHGPSLATEPAEESLRKASAMTKTSRPNDVRFSFTGAPRLEIWTNSEILIGATDYFLPVDRSTFAVSASARKTKRPKVTGPTSVELPEAGEEPFDDSDTEADEVLLKSLKSDDKFEAGSQQDSASTTETDLDFSFANVEISSTAYSTYRAVVLFLLTSHITWAPLRSSFDVDTDTAMAPDTSEPSSTRPMTLWSHHLADPSLPLPVSPKSVYRLANLLKLEKLELLALEAFKERLTVANVAEELFSDASVTFEELKRAAMEYATAHWTEVKDSAGWKTVVKKVATKESKVAQIGFELLGRTKA
ncbi:hypothetical protein RQP46_000501 [Phenoliferia psychrophenolica]